MGFLEGGPWSAGNIVEGDGVEVAKDGCRDVAGGPVGSDRSASAARVQAVSRETQSSPGWKVWELWFCSW